MFELLQGSMPFLVIAGLLLLLTVIGCWVWWLNKRSGRRDSQCRKDPKADHYLRGVESASSLDRVTRKPRSS